MKTDVDPDVAIFRNHRYFHGLGYRIHKERAEGRQVQSILQGPEGSRFEYVLDSDDAVLSTGGLSNATMEAMPVQLYFRFFSEGTDKPNKAKDKMIGAWWIDAEAYFLIRDWARDNDVSLSQAARRLLMIPLSWSRCSWVGSARLISPMKAFVGFGKPSAEVSPTNPKRNRETSPVILSPAHIQLKQWYVPGPPKMLSEVFRIQKLMDVRKKGAYL